MLQTLELCAYSSAVWDEIARTILQYICKHVAHSPQLWGSQGSEFRK